MGRTLQLLIDAGANPNGMNDQGETFLGAFGWSGFDPELARIAIEKGANPNLLDQHGSPPLFHSIGYPALVEILLEAGADPNFSHKPDGFTPLMHSMGALSAKTAEALLKNGAAVNVTNASGATAFHSLASQEPPGRASSDDAEERVLACIRLLKNHGADWTIADEDGRLPIHLAAANSFPCVLKWLLKQDGIDINIEDKKGRTPLESALAVQNVESALLLVGQGARLLENGTLRLLARGFHDSSQLEKNYLAGLEAFAPHETNINAVDEQGLSALMWASTTNVDAAVSLLLEKGSDFSLQAKDGRTALHFAAGCGAEEIVRLLLKAGANPEIRDAREFTPIDWAREWDHEEVIRLLDSTSE
jgi:ankyrin repeat protein